MVRGREHAIPRYNDTRTKFRPQSHTHIPRCCRYTNKALTAVFALQLLALTLTAALGFSAFGCLYKVCYNQRVYVNVDLSLGCPAGLALYAAGWTVALLSTATVFHYGAHHFAQKLRIVERKHGGGASPESFAKQTLVARSG